MMYVKYLAQVRCSVKVFLTLSPMQTKNNQIALAGVAQWIERWPVNQRVAGLIPS